MASSSVGFSLNEANADLFAQISDIYSIDTSWLAGQYTTFVDRKGLTPFCITSGCLLRELVRDGVAHVTFSIDFSSADKNDIKSISIREEPSKKHWLVTQTSLAHIKTSPECRPFIDISSVRQLRGYPRVSDLLAVQLCCDDWKLCLNKRWQHTDLERVQYDEARSNVYCLGQKLFQYHIELKEARNQLAVQSRTTKAAGSRRDYYWWQKNPVLSLLEKLFDVSDDIRLQLQSTSNAHAIESISEVVNRTESQVRELHAELLGHQALIRTAVSRGRKTKRQPKSKKRKFEAISDGASDSASSSKDPGSPVQDDGTMGVIELSSGSESSDEGEVGDNGYVAEIEEEYEGDVEDVVMAEDE